MKSTGKLDKTVLADANGALRDDDRKAEKVGTRKPPSIRQKEGRLNAEVRAWLNGESPLNQDSDALVKQVLAGASPFIHAMASKFESALVSKNWQTVADMLDGFEQQGFRFDTAPIKETYAGTHLTRTAPVRVLAHPDRISDAEVNLAIRLLKMGCSPNAMDSDGNTVLMRACRAGNEALATYILANCQEVDLHHCNDKGQDAFMLAKGQPKLLKLLRQADIGS